jgi:hypothetical protein
MPGVIDAASYIGIDASDLNEPTEPMTPQNRAWESYNPFGTFGSGQAAPLRNKEALSGGVTTMYIAPADAQLLGGQGAVVKSAGATLDGVLLREPAAIDIALGTPPKPPRARDRDPFTRMAEARCCGSCS